MRQITFWIPSTVVAYALVGAIGKPQDALVTDDAARVNALEEEKLMMLMLSMYDAR